MLEKIKKNKTALILILILVVGIFLRTYNLSDWLFFQADQARDLSLAEKTLEAGPGGLPLLGPKAGGTYLRLGPIFYYFQYVSGLVFGMDEPQKAAYPDLFFSILTIPLLFLFSRKFFSRNWSLAITAAYAVCFYAIQYSRFAWNPNSLPFFNLLFFYALLNFFDTSEKRKKILWTIIIGVSYAIASQLHYVCLFSLPMASGVIIIFRRVFFKKSIISVLKYFPIVIIVFIFFYIPVILSDMQTNGNNALNFLASFGKKSSDSAFWDLIKKDTFNFSKYFLIIFFGIIDASKKAYQLFGLLILSGFIAGTYFLKKLKDEKKNIFIMAVFAWFLSYVVVYFPIGSKVQPRHFLPILPIPFIFWGFIVLFLRKKILDKYKIPAFIALLALAFPIVLNAFSVKTWFGEIQDSQKIISNPRKSGLLKSVEGESWWHLKQAANFMKNDCEADKKKIVIVPPKQSWRSLVDYSLENVKETRDYSIKWGTVEYSPNFCYYHIYFSRDNFLDRYDWQVRELKKRSFGDISIARFIILPETLGGEEKIKNPFRKNKIEKVDLQEIENKNEEEADKNIESDENENDLDDESQKKNFDGLADEKDMGEEEIEKSDGESEDSWLMLEDVSREDRVFWRDLFR